MAFEGRNAFPLTPAGILEGAGEQSGVYAIHTPTRWVFVGDNDNVRQALFDHLNAPDGLDSFQPLSFSWVAAPPAERRALRDLLVGELRPACNGRRSRRRPHTARTTDVIKPLRHLVAHPLGRGSLTVEGRRS